MNIPLGAGMAIPKAKRKSLVLGRSKGERTGKKAVEIRPSPWALAASLRLQITGEAS